MTKDETTKLILKARAAQFGPDWSCCDPPKGAWIGRISELTDILAQVTNELEKRLG